MIAQFHDLMVPPLLAGTKVHTFRKGSRWRPGLRIDFAGKHRTPQQYRIIPSLPLVSIQPGVLHPDAVALDGRRLLPAELRLFARQDGFTSPEQMFRFFADRHRRRGGWQLEGQLLHWTPFRYLGPQEVAEPGRIAHYLARVVQAGQPEPLAGIEPLLVAVATCWLPAERPRTAAAVAAALEETALADWLGGNPVMATLLPVLPLARTTLREVAQTAEN